MNRITKVATTSATTLATLAALAGTAFASQVSVPVSHVATSATRPAVRVVSVKRAVLFSVTGSGFPSISYGSDSDDISVPGGHGILGDGVALPFHASLPYNSGAMYYDVWAQLEGSGRITATIRLETVTTYSNKSHKISTRTEAVSHAQGGYSIADPEWVLGF